MSLSEHRNTESKSGMAEEGYNLRRYAVSERSTLVEPDHP